MIIANALYAEIDRPTMRRGKCPRFPDAQVFRDYCARCGRCNRRECKVAN